MNVKINTTLNRGSEFAAGWDILSSENVTLKPGEVVVIPTTIETEIEPGYFGWIVDRSSTPTKKGVHVMAGIVDSDYRGRWGVVCMNITGKKLTIAKGVPIAQVIFMKLEPVVFSDGPLAPSERGDKAWGSSDSLDTKGFGS